MWEAVVGGMHIHNYVNASVCVFCMDVCAHECRSPRRTETLDSIEAEGTGH